MSVHYKWTVFIVGRQGWANHSSEVQTSVILVLLMYTKLACSVPVTACVVNIKRESHTCHACPNRFLFVYVCVCGYRFVCQYDKNFCFIILKWTWWSLKQPAVKKHDLYTPTLKTIAVENIFTQKLNWTKNKYLYMMQVISL